MSDKMQHLCAAAYYVGCWARCLRTGQTDLADTYHRLAMSEQAIAESK